MHELSDSEKRTLAADYWRDMHHEGEPLTWDDMTASEQWQVTSKFERQKASADMDAQQMAQVFAGIMTNIANCMKAVELIARQTMPPKQLARVMAQVVKEHSRSRGESETADMRLESLTRSCIKTTEQLTDVLEGLDARLRKLEGK